MTFFLLLTLLLFNFADQSLLSPLLNPLLRDFFGDTSRVMPLGWLSFAVMTLMAASMLVSGVLSDRTSRKKIAWAGCMIYGLASVLIVFTPPGRAGYPYFFALRCLCSAADAGVHSPPRVISPAAPASAKPRRVESSSRSISCSCSCRRYLRHAASFFCS